MFTRLVTELNNFLRPHYITTYSSDIFEDTLLKVAGVEQQPKKSHMMGIAEDLMKFEIIGLTKESATKFLEFLSKFDEGTSCVETDTDTYEFVTSVVGMYDLLPKFKYEVDQLKQNNPEQYQAYQKQCENDNAIQEYKLFEEIEKELDQVAQSDLSERSHGELHVIHENLHDMVKYHQEHYSHNCGAFEKLLDAINLFLKITQENEMLKNQEVINRVNTKLKEFLAFAIAREQIAQLARSLRALLEGEILEAAPEIEMVQTESKSSPNFGTFMNLFRSSPSSSSSSSGSEDDLTFEMDDVSPPADSPRPGR